MAAEPLSKISFARLVQFLSEHVRGKFYGSVTVQFRGGKIAVVRREETWTDQGQDLPVKDLDAVRMMETGRLSTS